MGLRQVAGPRKSRAVSYRGVPSAAVGKRCVGVPVVAAMATGRVSGHRLKESVAPRAIGGESEGGRVISTVRGRLHLSRGRVAVGRERWTPGGRVSMLTYIT